MGIPRLHKETSIYDPSTTIGGGIADAAGRVERYVTDISDGGIWVTPRDAKPGSDGNPVPTTRGWRIADAIELFRGAASVFKVWADTAVSAVARVRIGREDAGHVLLDDGGMDVLDGSGASLAEFGADGARVGTEDGAHVEVLPNALEILVGAVSYIRAGISGSASSVRIGKASAGHVTVTDSGLDVTGSDGSMSVASFGATARVGKASAGHLDIGSNGNAVFAGSASGTDVTVGGTGASYANPGIVFHEGGSERYELRCASNTAMQEAVALRSSTDSFPRWAFFGSNGFGHRLHQDRFSLAGYKLSNGSWKETQVFEMGSDGTVALAYPKKFRESLEISNKRHVKSATVTNGEAIAAGGTYTFQTTVEMDVGWLFTGIGRIGRSGTGSGSCVLAGFNTNTDTGGDVTVVVSYRNVGTSPVSKGAMSCNIELCAVEEDL